jgi:hypothetical protein
MYNKFFKNGKQVKLNKPAAPPRELEVIEKEHNQECWALGQLEYQVFVLRQEIESKNKKIQSLNYEGAERKKLNDQAKTAAPADTEQVTNG